MKIIKTAAAIAMGTLFAGAAFAQSDFGIERRDAYLDSRIHRGVATGQITGREAHRLEDQQAQIERIEARARADGRLSGHERARIDHAQDRLSRNIYRQSHDNQTSRNAGHSSHRPYGWDRGHGNGWGRGHSNGNGNAWGNSHSGYGHQSHGTSTTPRTGNAWGTGHSNGHYGGHGTSTAPRTRTDTGRSDRFAGHHAPMQQAHAHATPSPHSSTGGNRGSDNGRRTR